MPYSVEIIRKDDQSTSTWSGGTTTQLAIYPKSSDYKARNFKWRLSSARVEVEESTFTSLPGIYRHIMIIDGEMTLVHEEHHSILLKPFLQDSFNGGWTTISIGRARDFNLMLGDGCKGELEAIFIKKDIDIDATAIIPDKGCMNITQGFYIAYGSAEMLINGAEKYVLNEGDLAMVNYTTNEQFADIRLEGIDSRDTVIIRAGITYP